MTPANITLGTLYDQEFATLGGQTSRVLRAYTQKHGYQFHWTKVIGWMPGLRPMSWQKIPFVQTYLKLNPDCEWFMWIDADAIIMNHAVKVESFLSDCDLLIGDNDGDGPICAGVFCIRNTPAALQFLERVWQEPDAGHPWEQAAMAKHLRTVPGFRVRIVARRTFNSFRHEYERGDFIQHFAGGDKPRELIPA